MLGALLALLSAATFGMNTASLRRGVLSGSLLQALAITVPLGVPLFALGCLAFGAVGTIGEFSLLDWWWLSAAGIVHFVFGRYSNYRATRALGAAQSAPILQLSLFVALFHALVFLDERLTPLRALGIALILLGPMIVLRGAARKGAVVTRSGIKLNYLEGYFWGAMCALAFGTSPLLIRLGIEAGSIREGVAGGFVSYLAAAGLVALMLAIPRNFTHAMSLDPTAAKWFCATGVLVFVSQMFLYMALALAPVSVVATVQRTSVVFRVLFGWMLNREHEVLDPWIVVGIAISMIGVIAVTVSAEQVLALMPLPDATAEFLRLGWP